jgi:hypothetical protein
MSTKNKIKSTRKRQNRNGNFSQRRRKNGSAYTIRRGGFLTPVKQRFTAFRQRRAAAATARARESQARIDGNVSPRFRTSPGRWFRTRFRRNRSNAANPIPVNPINPSIYTHVQPDPDVIRHYSRIFSEESTASHIEKNKAIDDLQKYLDAVSSNSSGELERTMADVNGIVDESNANVDAIHNILSRGRPQVSDELDAYMANLSSHESSPRTHRTPPPPSFSPAGFVRHSRSGSNKQ